MTFGLVPHPPFVNRLITDAENSAWNNLGKKTINGVVLHRTLGTLWGTDSWFRRGAASTGLTSYCVGVAATDGAQYAGVIFVWNDPRGYAYSGISPNRAPWASGPYSSSGAFGDGKAFVQEYGTNAVNRDQAAIEISGNYDTPLDEAARNSIAGIMAYWGDQAHIPWEVWPEWNDHGYSFVRWHVEFCGEAEKPCPGTVVRGETDDLIERARSIMRQYQGGAAPAPRPPEEEDPLADIRKSGVKFDPKSIWPKYNPGSAVSDLWADYGEATGIWNPPGTVIWNDDIGGGCKGFGFDGGPLIALDSNGEAGIVVQTK